MLVSIVVSGVPSEYCAGAVPRLLVESIDVLRPDSPPQAANAQQARASIACLNDFIDMVLSVWCKSVLLPEKDVVPDVMLPRFISTAADSLKYCTS
jgi:hypothetical protein